MSRFFCSYLFDGQHVWRNSLVTADTEGMITAIAHDLEECPEGVTPLKVVLPGFVNSHSHGFQALFAGLAEQRLHPDDDFWSWRQQMYRCAAELSPEEMELIYTVLYSEMVSSGYTQVCEFHYLHHDQDGSPYSPLDTMARACQSAARRVGIGLTLLPVWYRYSQFGRQAPGKGQRRFIMDDVLWRDYLQALGDRPDDHLYALGVAAHSLRAVAIEDIELLAAPLAGRVGALPRHIHIAEQTKEVADCAATYGKRPIALLLDQEGAAISKGSKGWNLVHATHPTPEELELMVAKDAVAVLCPTTEANLGDGIFPYEAYLNPAGSQESGSIAIGSDSQVNLLPLVELQLMEYTARLTARRRSRLASATCASPARRLLSAVSRSAEATSGLPLGRIAVGSRCDLISYDPEALGFPEPLLMADDEILDYLMIHKPYERPERVFVGGTDAGATNLSTSLKRDFLAIRRRLAGEPTATV